MENLSASTQEKRGRSPAAARRGVVRAVIHAAAPLAAGLAFSISALSGQEPPTPAQSIAAGARVYGQKGCSTCHSINGIGGTVGPDLARRPARSLNDLIANMWAHLPKMAAQIAASDKPPPRLEPWEARDLAAFLFWAASFTPSGNAEAGATAFTDKGCVTCHQVGGVGGVIGPRLDVATAGLSSIDLAADMWNHAATMVGEAESRGVHWPVLTGNDIDNLMAYFAASGNQAPAEQVHALSGQPARGNRLFRELHCIQCHRIGTEGHAVGPDLTRAARREPSALAAEMWDKGPGMMAAMHKAGVQVPRLTAADMADLVAYLGSLQYVAGEGDAARGPEAALAGGCAGCHTIDGRGAGRAPDLGKMPQISSRAAVIAALYNHVRQPAAELAAAWQPLTAAQVADLVAFFERRGQVR